MIFLKILILITLMSIVIILIRYDRNEALKKEHVIWISQKIYRNESGLNTGAKRLHQTILGFTFIFFVGICVLFLIGLIEEYLSI